MQFAYCLFSAYIPFECLVLQVLHLINLCAARFGALACTAGGDDLFDDPSETQPCRVRDHANKTVLTPAAMRRMVGALLIMYRHIHLLAVCERVRPQGFLAPISKYHYEASTDLYNLLCMHISLPVGARIT